jgi:NTE family protein
VKTLINIFLIIALAGEAVAADTTRIFVGWDGKAYHPPRLNYRIGLALSGGGARGFAQVGVIKAFEEAGLQTEAIAGTSIGGIIGGLYASGLSADSLRKLIESIDFSALFSDRPSRTSLLLTQRQEKERYLISIRFNGWRPFIPQGLTAGQKLTDLISRLILPANYISGGSFSNMKIPFRAVTTDIVSGEEVVLSEGNLADAMRSTMAFPLAFTGVETKDGILMDGGMRNPIPADIVRSMSKELDLVIAINTTTPLLSKEKIKDPIDIANQVTTIMTMDKKEAGLRAADVVITPDIEEYAASDFDRAAELIEKGYLAGKRALPQIMTRLEKMYVGDSVSLTGVSILGIPSEENLSDWPLPSTGPIDRRALEESAGHLYKNGSFFSIAFHIIENGEHLNGYSTASLEVEAAPQPNLRDIGYEVRGNSIFSDSIIIDLLRNNGDRLTSEGIVCFSDSLKKMYRSRGYDLANIRRLDFNPRNNIVTIDFDEAILEAVRISGNLRTKNWLIRSNFPPKEGKPLSLRQASRGIANIYSTGLFDRVTMNLIPGNKGALVEIRVEEKKYTQVRLGWHWDEEYESEELAEILDDNLFGTGQEFMMHGQYGNRQQKYEISLKADRFFSTYLTYKVKMYYNIRERHIYGGGGETASSVRENRQGVGFSLGQQIARFGNVTGEIRWEDIKNKHLPGGTNDRIRLRTIGMRSLVETINRLSFPTAGKKHEFFIEYAADILGGQITYTKVFSSIESYFPITGRINFHPRISIGWTGTDYGIPLSEKFYNGGEYSFSGYRVDELTGDKMILGNLELRYRLPYRFYLTGRFDLGEMYESVEQIKLRNLRQGYGLSLAYDSPIGPIDIGYGKGNHRPDRWYVNVGLRF